MQDLCDEASLTVERLKMVKGYFNDYLERYLEGDAEKLRITWTYDAEHASLMACVLEDLISAAITQAEKVESETEKIWKRWAAE